jgi:hypothetical protein
VATSSFLGGEKIAIAENIKTYGDYMPCGVFTGETHAEASLVTQLRLELQP